MTQKPYNRGGIDQGLAELLGLKGQLNSDVESTIRLALIASDLTDSPYDRLSYPVAGEGLANPVVGECSFIGFFAGPNRVLQIKRFQLINNSGAAMNISVRLLSATDVTTVGFGAATKLLRFPSAEGGIWESVSSEWSAGSDPTFVIGTRILVEAVAGPGVLSVTLPEPGVFVSGVPSQVGFPRACIAVVGNSLNSGLSCGVYGKEWPLPG